MSNIEHFLTTTEEDAIVSAIREAEKNTSGEIRVHIEPNCVDKTFEHAIDVFHYLKMDNTKLQNAVLIYVAVDKKEFVIYGDKGINDIVGVDFWNSTRNLIESHFKNREFAQGLISGIQKTGEVLSQHFPWVHKDINELDNTISKG